MNNVEIDFGNNQFKINANLYMDGNAWSVGIGANLQEGCYGFGDSPLEAIEKFKDEMRNYRPRLTTGG